MASGLRGPDWTPRGVQRPPGVSSVKGLILRRFGRDQAALASGWLPKNPALSLAICRASPASIRFGPERNRKTEAWRLGPRLDPSVDPGSQRQRCAPRSSPENIPFVGLSRGPVNPFQCLSENRLT